MNFSWITDSKNQKTVLIGIVAILILLLWRGCQDRKALESANLQAVNNLLALQDTVRIEKNKNGDIQYVKNAFITDLKDLKDMNIDLYNEVRAQQKTIFFISQMTASIRDSLKRKSSGDKASFNSTTGFDQISWNFDTIGTDWSRTLNGKSLFTVKMDSLGKYTVAPQYSILDNFNQTMKITTGIQESKTQPGMPEIFIKSSYPGMIFTDINGAIVNPEDFKKFLASPKPKKWSFGPYIGLGYGLTLEKSTRLVPVLNIGLGVQYKLFNF